MGWILDRPVPECHVAQWGETLSNRGRLRKFIQHYTDYRGNQLALPKERLRMIAMRIRADLEASGKWTR